MPSPNYISRIKIGTDYYRIKDEEARQILAGGVSFNIAWDGTGVPDTTKIPAGVVVTYNSQDYTGLLSADSVLTRAFYLVKSSTLSGTSMNVYDEYVVVGNGLDENARWELIGNTQLSLQGLGDLATRNTVTLNKGTADSVLGADTTFELDSTPALTFGNHTTKSALGTSATFNTSVTPTTTKYKATATGAALSTSNDTFVKSYPGSTLKLVTTTIKDITDVSSVSIPNVTNVGSASTWNFAMGSGDDAETLIISGSNGSAPTLGNALSASAVTLAQNDKTVATGSVANDGTGSDVMVGLGTASTGSALTSASVSTQPTIAFEEDNNGTAFVTGISSATTSVNSDDAVTAITALGTAAISKPNISVGTNDLVSVAVHGNLSVTVS